MSQVETDVVEKRGNQWCVVHCHGEETGEVIKCFDTKEEAEAMHRAIQANKVDAQKQRKISFDVAQLDAKPIIDDDDVLTMPAVIASEIVHQYEDGWAYKPADELEKMAATANRIGSIPVKILEHPNADTSYLLVKQSDVYGKVSNFKFVRDLKEIKTKRPMRRGVRADITWFKDVTPADVIERIKAGTLHDVSIGFTFDADETEGEFQGVHYDYVQRNIFLNHVAAPIEAGRCAGPVCGIGYDATTTIKFDAGVMETCPVCRTIRDVGFAVAGKRLYAKYGSAILKVIEDSQPTLTPEQKTDENDLTKEFTVAFRELDSNLQK